MILFVSIKFGEYLSGISCCKRKHKDIKPMLKAMRKYGQVAKKKNHGGQSSTIVPLKIQISGGCDFLQRVSYSSSLWDISLIGKLKQKVDICIYSCMGISSSEQAGYRG